ncbi:MAG: DUF6033 family protein [Lachnospiraceae bacterium]
MNFTTKMTEQYVQQLYQNNAGAKDNIKNQGAAGKSAQKKPWQSKQWETEMQDEAAVYEPGSKQAEKTATYQKPVGVAKKDKNSDLKAKLEATYEGLSKEAKDYLEELKKKFGNIDFFVADCKSDEEMNRYFAMGGKDYTCVISSDLLERMATEEDVRAKYENVIDGADESIEEMRTQIKEELGEEAAGQITNFGITIDDNGVVEYFAKVKDSNDTYYAKLKEKREEAKQEAKAEKDKEKAKEKAKEAQEEWLSEKKEGLPEKDAYWLRADSKEGLLEAIRKALGLTATEKSEAVQVEETPNAENGTEK